MNPRKLFLASCIALVTSAFTFSIRGDILPALGDEFTLTQEQRGWIASGAFTGMAVSMLAGAPLCDLLGMGNILRLAFLCHLLGVFGTIFAPHGATAFSILYGSTFIAGCGNGLVEIGINPLAATLYPNQKTHYLNLLHAWWPGGLVIGGLLAIGISQAMGLRVEGVAASTASLGWKIKMGAILVPTLVYGAMFLGQRFPVTERVASGVSTGEMFREALRPMFLLWAFCMLLTAATELGPQQWQESVLTRTAGISGTLILVYTSGMMFVLRHFAGPLAHRFSPIGMLTGSAALAAIGLFLLSHADAAATAFLYATVYGLGIAYFWPTMLGVTAERFPKGGALLLGLMGCAGNLSIAAVLPEMGRIVDHYTTENLSPSVAELVVKDGKPDPAAINQLQGEAAAEAEHALSIGFAMAFRWVSVLPTFLVLIFGGIVVYDRSKGGYRAVQLAPGVEPSGP